MVVSVASQCFRGYTIVELMVVVLVLAVLATLAFPIAEMQVRRERERELKRGLWEIRDAIDAYKRMYDSGRLPQASGASGYPPSLQALVQGVLQSDTGQPVYLLRRIPRDP